MLNIEKQKIKNNGRLKYAYIIITLNNKTLNIKDRDWQCIKNMTQLYELYGICKKLTSNVMIKGG